MDILGNLRLGAAGGAILCLAFMPARAEARRASCVVAPHGGDFASLQAAIDSAPANSAGRFLILVKNGRYASEKLIVPPDRKNITIRGESRSGTVISYCMSGSPPRADRAAMPPQMRARWESDPAFAATSATLTVLGDGFRLENLTIENTAGPRGQAQALTLLGDRLSFFDCDILGYQDTLYLWGEGRRSYFENCLIAGRTDYIYGGGVGYFQSCEIRSYGGGWITAPATPDGQKYGFVFRGCRFTYSQPSPRRGDDGRPVALGRPWQKYPKVAILDSEMCAEIDPRGWPDKWRMDYADSSPSLRLLEHSNTGPGADMRRRSPWAGIRAMAPGEAEMYTPCRVLGGNWWR